MHINSVILHDIRSIHNVGAILRTCDGFGVQTVYIGGVTPYPRIKGDQRLPHIIEKQTKDIAKTALGAEQTLSIVHYDSIDELISSLQKSSVDIVALEQSNTSQTLASFTSKNPISLLLGREVEGIDTHLLQSCDHIVEIPMFGTKESFNVSVACGIALYALHLASND